MCCWAAVSDVWDVEGESFVTMQSPCHHSFC
jgi:hypothetical protein